jgi:hypothetical protein
LGVAAQRSQHVVRPPQQLVAVGGRDAQHVADHHHRERSREIAHEVALTVLAHAVDEIVTDLGDVVARRAHPSGREAAAHELAPLQVAGRVHVDHPRHRSRVGTAAARARERRGIAPDGHHSGVGRNTPEIVALVEVHGSVRAHPRVPVAGAIDVEIGCEQVDRRRVHVRRP